jgi:very-short-patch-repair endonuclease
MTTTSDHASARALAEQQHNNVTRAQLRALGYSSAAIRHGLSSGRLHRVFRGVYAWGRPHETLEGLWMAAVLRCGPGAALSHDSAAACLGIRPRLKGRIEVSVPWCRKVREPGIRIHRTRTLVPGDVGTCDLIPITSPVRTLIDISPRLAPKQRERAINEADRIGLIDTEELRRGLDADDVRRHGAALLRRTLDRRTFTKTRSELERDFLPLARAAGLPRPLTCQVVNGFEVDFYWPDLGLIVESDGLRYHRTPAQQAVDRRRDQVHTAAGLTALRFTDEQIDFEQRHVVATLAAVAGRLTASRPSDRCS